MTVVRRGGGFQASFMVGGIRYRAQFEDLKGAEAWEEDTRIAIKRGKPLPPASGTGSSSIAAKFGTLGSCFSYTVEHVWAGLKSERDLTRNGRYVVEHFGTNLPVKSIGRFEIDNFILSLKDQRNSGATINRKLAALSRILRTAVELGALKHKPSLPRQREAEGRERYLERSEVAAIVQTLRTWSKPDHGDLVEFLVATGCRINEALSLAWKDVKPGYVTVIGMKSKTSKTRHIPIPPDLSEKLSARMPGRSKGPFDDITYQSFRHSFEKVLGHLRLDEDDVVIHTLRHTTASWLAIAGVDIYRIMQFMGHSNVSTTQRYAKLSPNSLDGLSSVISGVAA
jgi:integrase